jgi:hypothetical protein
MQHVSPYRSAAELGISETERAGLIDLSRKMAAPDFAERFDMAGWCDCIHSNLQRSIGQEVRIGGPMFKLFLGQAPCWKTEGLLNRTPIEGATAILSFLSGMNVSSF